MGITLIITGPLLGGYVLDLLLGDPEGWPHPVRFFGWLISKGEHRLNRGRYLLCKGGLLAICLFAGIYGLTYAMVYFLLTYAVPLYLISGTLLVWYALAGQSLVRAGNAVFKALDTQGLDAGRKKLSWIVGRDTSMLTENQVRTAVLETMSENLSDGVIAPLFFYLLAGLPGMLSYKMINTLDSMIGYRNPRYLLFGRFAARLDDVANFIPARLTAVLMVLISRSSRGWKFLRLYGRQHKSPNSGYPEAALAGILDVRFGGPHTYQGILVDKPYIGNNDRQIGPDEIKVVSSLNHTVCFLMVAAMVIYFYSN